MTGASTVEALVGAVWLDSDRNIVKVHHVVHNMKIGSSLARDRSHDYGRV